MLSRQVGEIRSNCILIEVMNSLLRDGNKMCCFLHTNGMQLIDDIFASERHYESIDDDMLR